MKKLLIAGLLASLPLTVKAEPSDYTLWLDSYKLDVRPFSPGSRPRITDTLLCLDEFDYVYLKGYIDDAATLCTKKAEYEKKERDRICDESKAEIRKRCEAQEALVKADLEQMTLDFHRKDSELKDAIARHESEIFKHYLIEGSIAAILVGVLAVVIAK